MTATVSQTARRVAALRRGFDRPVWPTGNAVADDRLQADVAAGAEPHADARFTRYLERRTAFFDIAVVDAIGRGVAQVVVLGCGYDGRSLRFRTDRVQWYDVDHPMTLVDRLTRLDHLGITADARAVPADFGADDVAVLLTAAGFDPTLPSLFVCEGVTPYLTEADVRRVLAAIGGIAPSAKELAVDFALQPETAADAAARAALAARVEAVEEPFRFTPTRFEIAPLLQACGWQPTFAVDPAGVPMLRSTGRTVFVSAVGPAAPSDPA